eukprot:GEMP01031046.1.p1 GENE.GEMP01031046.1~~GEMP01031046.1.p1  ORF type:complete len:558 (+),score=104.55 GEMP01031046.1:239-1675(+)
MLEAIHQAKETNEGGTKKTLAQKRRRLPGEQSQPFVIFLHDLGGSLSDSWCFLKFVMPLYNHDFDLLLIDLPGFGKSSIANNFGCELKRWRNCASNMIAYIIDEAEIPKSHFVCAGGSAAIFFKLLSKSPDRMHQRHILINPVISKEDLADELMPQKLGEILRNTSAHVHVFYDSRTYGDKGKLRPNWIMLETIHLLEELATDDIISNHITVVEICNYDLTTVLLAPSPSLGVKPVHGLLPSAYFVAFAREYLLGIKLPPYHLGQTDVKEALPDEANHGQGREEAEQKNERASKLVRAKSTVSNVSMHSSVHSESKAETAKQRRTRLNKWSQNPIDPDLSYGVRLRDRDELEAITELKKQSAAEYEELYGQSDRQIRLAKKASEATFQEESMDERLIELRQRAPLDEREQIRQWQLAAEESFKLELLHEMTEEELLRKGVEESLNFYVAEENEIDKAIKESQETHDLETLARQGGTNE